MSDRSSGLAARSFEPLMERANRFTLFAALRWIECRSGMTPRLGETPRIGDDPVRIVPDLTVRFAPSEVAAAVASAPLRLHIENFGLFGCNGPLPAHLTEYAAAREREDEDRVFRDFVNLFEHRMATLFYRAWASAEPVVDYERFHSYLAALLGIVEEPLRNRDVVDDAAKCHRAGRFALATKPLEGLEDVLSDYFGCDVRLMPFDPRWLDIPQDQLFRLGSSWGNRLGFESTPGHRSWQCQFSFRIVVRDLTFARFVGFLPGSDSLSALRDLVLLYVGRELHWNVELRLLPGEAPPLKLAGGMRLGWSTWIGRGIKTKARVRIRDASIVERGRPGASEPLQRSNHHG